MAAVNRPVWPLLPLIALASCGCGSQVRLYIESSGATNGGRPLRVLVRAVDARSYVADSYERVAQEVTNPDDSVLYDGIVYPGFPNSASFKRGKDKAVAIYFFFTAPGPRWKTLIDQPLPRVEYMRLRSDEIDGAERSD